MPLDPEQPRMAIAQPRQDGLAGSSIGTFRTHADGGITLLALTQSLVPQFGAPVRRQESGIDPIDGLPETDGQPALQNGRDQRLDRDLGPTARELDVQTQDGGRLQLGHQGSQTLEGLGEGRHRTGNIGGQ